MSIFKKKKPEVVVPVACPVCGNATSEAVCPVDGAAMPVVTE